MRVLLVDDHPLMHELMPEVLRKAIGPVEVVAVRDLEAAFQQLAHHKPPDLALLDLGLPPAHAGVDTLRRFRWKFASVPVVVVSSTEDEASVRVARKMGAVGYIPKSLPADEMVEAVRRVVAGGTFFPGGAAS
ncbi:MAG TPA: response regulator transcription factor [Burkholderiales bacterium]|jgi:DNA-binding NarL/FixJ family response regulator